MDPDTVASTSAAAAALSPPPDPPTSASPTPAPTTPNLSFAHHPPRRGVIPPISGSQSISEDLHVELADARAQIAQLEADKEFLRARYTEVDAFATSTRTELTALRESEAIARSQATDGVELVRNTLRDRVIFLEGEVTRLTKQNHLLAERDRLTGEDLRARAARVEEVEAETARWRRRAGNAEREVERLRDALENIDDGEYRPPGLEKTEREGEASQMEKVVDVVTSKADELMAGFVASMCTSCYDCIKCSLGCRQCLSTFMNIIWTPLSCWIRSMVDTDLVSKGYSWNSRELRSSSLIRTSSHSQS